jgi:tetratricopeptide (TPR) repeat protein
MVEVWLRAFEGNYPRNAAGIRRAIHGQTCPYTSKVDAEEPSAKQVRMTDQPNPEDLKRILQLQKERRYDEALSLGLQLLASYPQSHLVHKQLAHVHDAMKNFQAAIREITEAIAISPREPDFYFNRARWYLETGRNNEAVADCDVAIALETSMGRAYYLSSSYFIRAFAKLQSGDYAGGLDDCQHVDDDPIFWVLGASRTKEPLEEELRRRLGAS